MPVQKYVSDVHSDFTYNSQNLDTTQMSINKGINKQILYPYKRILFAIKRNEC